MYVLSDCTGWLAFEVSNIFISFSNYLEWKILLAKIPLGGHLLESALISYYACITRTVNFGKVFIKTCVSAKASK